jgi:hypothetical protein
MAAAGKQFFFEKKNQKTFAPGVRGGAPRTETDKSFLVLFFKKELLPFFCPTNPRCA